MRTLKLVVEYDGTGLSGWQRQANGMTVQEHLENALQALVRAPVAVQGASRTDAGVHALGQVAHFVTDAPIPAHGFMRGLNSHLPESIAVRACQEVAAGFHARFDSRGKHYRYLLHNHPARSPLTRTRAWHRPRPLDLAAMQQAAGHLRGERDFRVFQASGCTAKTTTRRVHAVSVRSLDTGLIAVDVIGNAFLRNMVRIMAGTLVAVGSGRLDAGHLPGILDSGDRARAGQTAPAQGLTLMRVFYDSAELLDVAATHT